MVNRLYQIAKPIYLTCAKFTAIILNKAILPVVTVSINSQLMLFGFNAKRHLLWVHRCVMFPSQVILLNFNQNISSLSELYQRVWNWKQLWGKQVSNRNSVEKKIFAIVKFLIIEVGGRETRSNRSIHKSAQSTKEPLQSSQSAKNAEEGTVGRKNWLKSKHFVTLQKPGGGLSSMYLFSGKNKCWRTYQYFLQYHITTRVNVWKGNKCLFFFRVPRPCFRPFDDK